MLAGKFVTQQQTAKEGLSPRRSQNVSVGGSEGLKTMHIVHIDLIVLQSFQFFVMLLTILISRRLREIHSFSKQFDEFIGCNF
jgi:hypothetical protein